MNDDPANPASEGREGVVAGGGVAQTVEPLWRPLALYTGARLGLTVVLTAVLAPFMPLVVALMFALVAQLPLAWALFGKLRMRTNAAMAGRNAAHRAERDRLHAALRGDEPDER